MTANPTPFPSLINRAGVHPVALETTLLLHGVPRPSAFPLAKELAHLIQSHSATPALIGVLGGVPIAGVCDDELATLLAAPTVPKANTANLGALLAQHSHAATTVSTTMEIAAAAGIRVFATGGLGGVHQGYAQHLDISADLAAFTRFPVAVVCSGVKSILDVAATREALETLGIPVIGYQTDHFPAFYLRESSAGVDARFDDPQSLATYISRELARTRRGIVIANPIPVSSEIPRIQWEPWLAAAKANAVAAGVQGRDTTPFLLAQLHAISGGVTLRANLNLVRSNTTLAAQLAAAIND